MIKIKTGKILTLSGLTINTFSDGSCSFKKNSDEPITEDENYLFTSVFTDNMFRTQFKEEYQTDLNSIK